MLKQKGRRTIRICDWRGCNELATHSYEYAPGKTQDTCDLHWEKLRRLGSDREEK